jgi:Transposase DDE domain
VELDLETFLTALYVVTDDLYVKFVLPQMPVSGGPEPKLSDAEVLCLGLAAQWQLGVPWHSERSFVRYAMAHLRPLFPGMTSQSAFNRRLRRLWGAFILLQQAVVQELEAQHLCEIVDCVPVRIARNARSFQPKRLADIARRGKGGNDGFFYGCRLLLAVTPAGLATGWTLASGNVQDRWLAELLFSARAGRPQLGQPPTPVSGHRPVPPSDWVGPMQSCGSAFPGPIVADLGYYGDNWYGHWLSNYGVQVLTAPFTNRKAVGRWFNSLRHGIETAFASLSGVFGLSYPDAHTFWGLLTRTAAKIAAYNVGVQLNRQLARPDFAFGTLIA